MTSLSMTEEDKQIRAWCAVLYPQLESFMLQTMFVSYRKALLLRFMFLGDGSV